ncbi:MAG: long-chain fatty acid--CoA ligase [Candidatus Bathyarchaeia archaeon]
MTPKSLERPWLNSWPKNVPHSIDYAKIPLGEILRGLAAKSQERPAVYFSDREITYRELDKLADRFGAALQDVGIRKGDRVAIYLPNLPQFVFAYYGALRVGAIVVTASPLYKERELAHILTDSGAKVLLCLDKLYPYVDSVKEKTQLSQVFTTSASDYLPNHPTPSPPSDAKDLCTCLAGYNSHPKTVQIDPRKDLALLQYTGGTTGVPKGAMLTHYNLVVNAVQFSSWLGMTMGAEVHLSVLPFFHIYGMTVAMNVPVYTSSAMILIPDGRDIAAILQAVDTYKPTFFCGVPAMYIALINQPDIRQHDLRSIRVCVSGASPLPVRVQREFEALTGGRLVEGYGLTETSPVTHVNPLDEPGKNRSGSIGIPISDTEAKIVDLDTGVNEPPPGTVGELVIRGPQVMTGYWNNPGETKMAIRDGWFYTGDIAVMDSDGYFRLVDRKKDMINVSGLKVWPREVEDVLYEHPAVKEATAVAVIDQTSGEAVKAFVVLKEEFKGKIAADTLITFCKDKIADYKAPKVVEFRDALPKSSVGKILRRELRIQPSR